MKRKIEYRVIVTIDDERPAEEVAEDAEHLRITMLDSLGPFVFGEMAATAEITSISGAD